MAREVETIVEKHSKAKGNAYTVLKALADEANSAGVAEILIIHLAQRCRVSRSAIDRSLKYLVRLGEIKVTSRKALGLPNLYIVQVEQLKKQDCLIDTAALESHFDVPPSCQNDIPPTCQNDVPPSCQNDMRVRQNDMWGTSKRHEGVCQNDMSSINPKINNKINNSFYLVETEKPEPLLIGSLMPEELRQWAERIYPLLDIEKCFGDFKEFNIIKEKKNRDWSGQFRGWLRKAEKLRQDAVTQQEKMRAAAHVGQSSYQESSALVFSGKSGSGAGASVSNRPGSADTDAPVTDWRELADAMASQQLWHVVEGLRDDAITDNQPDRVIYLEGLLASRQRAA